MADQNTLQASRYELKYVVDESQARYLRALIRGYTVADEHMKPDSTVGYQVNSLYLDSSALDLCRQTVHGHKNRFKLRLRFYGDDSPIFAEVKQRVGDVIRKQRAVVRREAEEWLLKGGIDACQEVACRDARSVDALRHFARLRDMMGAVPQAYVSYLREAYMSPGSNDLRITFDRRIVGCRYRTGEGLRLPPRAAPVPTGGVVFEIKFTNTFPRWLNSVVRTLHLRRSSYPKYVECIRVLRIPFSDRFPAEVGIAS
jgi:hypothetical protein